MRGNTKKALGFVLFIVISVVFALIAYSSRQDVNLQQGAFFVSIFSAVAALGILFWRPDN